MSDTPEAGGSPANELQFDRAEYTSPAPAATCRICSLPMRDIYYEINGQPICPSCREHVQQAQSGGSPFGRFARATLYGALAGLAGAVIYYGVREATKIEFGLISIVVGLMVGKAVKKGCNGRGGWFYQGLAMFLTYTAIMATYVPLVMSEIGKRAAEKKAAVADKQPVAAGKQPAAADKKAASGGKQGSAEAADKLPVAAGKQPAGADKKAASSGKLESAEAADKLPVVAGKQPPAADKKAASGGKLESADAADKQPVAAGKQPPAADKKAAAGDKQESAAADDDEDVLGDVAAGPLPPVLKLLIAVVLLVCFFYAIPILVGFQSPMALVIIGIGLWEAWVMNRRVPLIVKGPFRIGQADTGIAADVKPAS